MRIAAGIVTYGINQDIIENIHKMETVFDKIFVYDNTEGKDAYRAVDSLNRSDKVIFRSRQRNLGMAYGMNVNCRQALRHEFQWIMLLDQDSLIDEKALAEMKKFLQEKMALFQIGAAAAVIQDRDMKMPHVNAYKECNLLMTSGMILNLQAYRQCGPFDNSMFVDWTDYEYCLRLKKNGWRLFQNGNAVLKHNVFDREKMLGGYKVNKYGPLKHYYNMRNYLYVKKKYGREYPKVMKRETEVMLWRFSNLLHYDSRRLSKLWGIFLGWLDYMCGYSGKCRWRLY